MDVFIEQLYKRKKDTKDILMQVGIFAGTIVLATVASTIITNFIPIPIPSFKFTLSLLAIIGIVYFGYKLYMKLELEYEYLYLNGELDFDKIMAKIERKRLLNVKVQNFERFGLYDDTSSAKLKTEQFDKIFNFNSNTGKSLYYAVFKHKEYNKTLLIFEPKQEILDDILKLTRNIQRYGA